MLLDYFVFSLLLPTTRAYTASDVLGGLVASLDQANMGIAVQALSPLFGDNVSSAIYIDALLGEPANASVISDFNSTSYTTNALLVPQLTSYLTSSTAAGDPSFVLPYLLYNLIQGPIDPSSIALSPNHTILTTSLANSSFVTLENGNHQALVVTADYNGTIYVLNQQADVYLAPQPNPLNVDGGAFFFTWAVTTQLLVFPENISSAAVPANFSAFISSANATGVLSTFESQRGLTLFAPQDTAVEMVTTLRTLTASDLATIWKGHAVSGTHYSPQLLNQKYPSLVGLQLSISVDGTTVTIEGGNSAKIIASDVLVSNGVVHIIDSVLMSSETASSGGASDGSSNSVSRNLHTRHCGFLAGAVGAMGLLIPELV